MNIPPRRLSVLIVDDHAEMRQLMRSLLTGLGAEVNERADGSEAASAYREYSPDWVLMDIKMKDLNGIDATRQLRAIFPKARVIIVSEMGNASFRKAAREAGACAYVLKEELLTLPAILRQMDAEPDSCVKPSLDKPPGSISMTLAFLAVAYVMAPQFGPA